MGGKGGGGLPPSYPSFPTVGSFSAWRNFTQAFPQTAWGKGEGEGEHTKRMLQASTRSSTLIFASSGKEPSTLAEDTSSHGRALPWLWLREQLQFDWGKNGLTSAAGTGRKGRSGRRGCTPHARTRVYVRACARARPTFAFCRDGEKKCRMYHDYRSICFDTVTVKPELNAIG